MKVVKDNDKDYILKEGDTLESVSKNNNMSLDELINLNGIRDRAKLGVGNILKVKVNKNGKD